MIEKMKVTDLRCDGDDIRHKVNEIIDYINSMEEMREKALIQLKAVREFSDILKRA